MRYESEHCSFDFYYLGRYGATHEQIKKFSDAHYQQFLSLCKDDSGQLHMTTRVNTEWILRTYNATKMIMAATLLLNSAGYCMDKNLMISVPYLLYYAALSTARGLLYVSPLNQPKDLTGLIAPTHSKILKAVPDDIKNHFGKELAEQVGSLLNYLRSQREYFSYQFPASGIRENIKFDETVEVCGLLAELTELGSYQIQRAYEERFLDTTQKQSDARKTWMQFDPEVVKKAYTYEEPLETGQKAQWIDSDDWYRIDYIERKIKYPTSILYTMTEGMVDDFFGSWCDSAEDDNDEKFNPDQNWNRIFPIP